MTQARMFDDNLYRFGQAQDSYWEASTDERVLDAPALQRDERCDVAIIGGGYTGLSAALHLARDYGVDVRVLEAGHIGWGASGRNGGFCTVGGTALHRGGLIQQVGLDAARDYYRSSVDAVELVRALATDEGIDYEAFGSAELEVAHSPSAAKQLEEDRDVLTRQLGMDVELVSADACRERYYDSTETHAALLHRPAFGLHPLRYCHGLARAAAARGAKLHARSRVLDWRRDGSKHRLVTDGGVLRADRVVYAVNGFIDEALNPEFHGRTLPIVSAIVVTRPLTDDELAGQCWRTEHPSINTWRIMNYFRLLPDKRFLFGGRGHHRGDVEGEARNYDDIVTTMRQVFPAWENVDIEYRWHGLICYARSFRPSIGRLEDDQSVYFGFGYHGNGVNTATWAGAKLAQWIGMGRQPADLPSAVTGLSRRFGAPRLRSLSFRTGVAIAKLLDRRGRVRAV